MAFSDDARLEIRSRVGLTNVKMVFTRCLIVDGKIIMLSPFYCDLEHIRKDHTLLYLLLALWPRINSNVLSPKTRVLTRSEPS